MLWLMSLHEVVKLFLEIIKHKCSKIYLIALDVYLEVSFKRWTGNNYRLP